MTYLDTHSAVWLRRGDKDAFPKRARRAIEADDVLLISPIVVLELEMLHEIGRVKSPAHDFVRDLRNYMGVRVCDYPFALVIDQALAEEWTREPADRIIVAHARSRRATLITQDEKIRAHYDLALW